MPDLVGIVQHGVVYTGGVKKIAEHGGNDPKTATWRSSSRAPERGAPLLVDVYVETTQIAPSILALLGLDPHDLQAVRIEHTDVLPSLTAREPADRHQ